MVSAVKRRLNGNAIRNAHIRASNKNSTDNKKTPSRSASTTGRRGGRVVKIASPSAKKPQTEDKKPKETKRTSQARDAEALTAQIADSYPDCDVECHRGGQPLYYYLISVE